MFVKADCVFLLFESPVNLVSIWKLLEHELFSFDLRVLLFTRNFSTRFFLTWGIFENELDARAKDTWE
jgi:hypothetical protein